MLDIRSLMFPCYKEMQEPNFWVQLLKQYVARCRVIDMKFNKNYAKTDYLKRSLSCGHNMKVKSIDVVDKVHFNGHKNAFSSKTTSEILRALFILRISSIDFVVNHANKFIYIGRRLLSKRVFDFLLKRCVYNQFVAGENHHEIQQCVKSLHRNGIQVMLAIPIEDDLSEEQRSTEIRKSVYDKNLQTFLDCFHLESVLQPNSPLVQIRMSAIVSPKLLARISEICPNPVQTSSILITLVNAIVNKERFKLNGLTEIEEEELNDVTKRLIRIGETAVQTGVMAMVDAEYTYFNGATKLFVLALMLIYNVQKAFICFTYQNYLKETFGLLKQDVEFILSNNRYFGTKLVRGAYLQKENELARLHGYSSPIHDNFENTSNMYNQSMDYLMQHLARNSKCAFMVASHNERTIEYAIQRALDLKVDVNGGGLFFGQLYGMCDHVSFSLGNASYPIYKSVPYGKIDDTLPYLIRRAQENRSVLPGARRERELLKLALIDRCYKS